MTSREFARYNPRPVVEHPEDDIPEEDVETSAETSAGEDVFDLPLRRKRPLEKSYGWKKTKLEKAGVKGDWLTLKDDAGLLQMKWKSLKPGSDTYKNLVKLLKGDDRLWRVSWFQDSNGVRYAKEILDDKQYEHYQKTAWQNRKLYLEGFATANPFIS